ncbi:MAG: hypothetical protein ACQEWW_17495 [Bacillota bacterium]
MDSNSFLKKKKFGNQSTQSIQKEQEDFSLKLLSNLDENLHYIKSMLDNPSDLITREFTIGNTHHRCAILLYTVFI